MVHSCVLKVGPHLLYVRVYVPLPLPLCGVVGYDVSTTFLSFLNDLFWQYLHCSAVPMTHHEPQLSTPQSVMRPPGPDMMLQTSNVCAILI